MRAWLEQDLPLFFSGRLLAVDETVAHRWGHSLAPMGRPLPLIDSLLAAAALAGLVINTRPARKGLEAT